MKRRTPRIPIALFATFWCLIVGVFDVVLVGQTLRQIDASRRFLPTTATVIEVSVESSTDSDGTTYRPRVVYEYTVAGSTHRSETVHFAVWGSSDRGPAEEIADRFKAGSRTTAFYDPDDPTQAVLLPGAEHLPSFLVLFLTPFHCVGAGLWIGVLGSRGGPYEDPALRRAIRSDDGTVARLRSARAPLWLVFLAVLGGGAFVSVFVIALTAGFAAPMSVSFGTLGGLVVFAGAACVAAARRRTPELVLDRAARTIGRPGLLRSDRFAVPESPTRFADIREIAIESKPWGEVNDEPYYRHTLRAVRAGRDEPLELVRLVGAAGSAEPLAAWFREQIGLAPPTPGPCSSP